MNVCSPFLFICPSLLYLFWGQQKSSPRYLITFSSPISWSISWHCFSFYLSTFSKSHFNLGLCIANPLNLCKSENSFLFLQIWTGLSLDIKFEAQNSFLYFRIAVPVAVEKSEGHLFLVPSSGIFSFSLGEKKSVILLSWYSQILL